MASFATKALENPKKRPLTDSEFESLMDECDVAIADAQKEIQEAHHIVAQAGLTLDTEFLQMVRNQQGSAAAATTAGHSNTDHIVVYTKDEKTDRISELRRNMLIRMKTQQPESKKEDRWDKPKIPGERRRRIVREKDEPNAPSEPPSTGYMAFVGQMTTKIRHDRIDQPHDQTKVVQEISKIWRIVLTDAQRRYYDEFSEQARKEYRKQLMEFRATGQFAPSQTFERLQGVGQWVKKKVDERNPLEREIAEYDTVIFPPRPPELDQDYNKRAQVSKLRRKLKLKGRLNPDGSIPEEYMQELNDQDPSSDMKTEGADDDDDGLPDDNDDELPYEDFDSEPEDLKENDSTPSE